MRVLFKRGATRHPSQNRLQRAVALALRRVGRNRIDGVLDRRHRFPQQRAEVVRCVGEKVFIDVDLAGGPEFIDGLLRRVGGQRGHPRARLFVFLFQWKARHVNLQPARLQIVRRLHRALESGLARLVVLTDVYALELARQIKQLVEVAVGKLVRHGRERRETALHEGDAVRDAFRDDDEVRFRQQRVLVEEIAVVHARGDVPPLLVRQLQFFVLRPLVFVLFRPRGLPGDEIDDAALFPVREHIPVFEYGQQILLKVVIEAARLRYVRRRVFLFFEMREQPVVI
ncbi:MAG: hypothetical protein BWY28_03258 [bacterium ADurb.Bin236]|nr:MAG: hypothetical protein BWY28_03258 [bacterium ADurb.Bin236]